MSFFRNFTFNITQNTDIELQDIEEGSGSALTSSNTSASIPISHPLNVFNSNLTQNPDIEIRDIQAEQEDGLPNFSLATTGNVPAPIDIPTPPYAEAAEPLGSDQDAQMTQAPDANPLISGDCTMTGPDNLNPQNPDIRDIHAGQQDAGHPNFSLATTGNVPIPTDIPNPYAKPLGSDRDAQTTQAPVAHPLMTNPLTTSARKRSHHVRERTDKVRIVEQSSRLPREKAVQMSRIIEQKYENQFQHKATEFVDKMVEQFKVRQSELEKQYNESKQKAEEADERAVEATQKATEALKRASVVEEQARHAIEKAQMMETRYLEMISRENRNSGPVEVEKADDALKRASVMEEQARRAIEKAQMMETRYLEMMTRENRNSEPTAVVSVNDPCSKLLPIDYTTIQERNETPYDNDINIYGIITSEDTGNAPSRGPSSKGDTWDDSVNPWSPLSKGKGRDMGYDRGDDDEHLDHGNPWDRLSKGKGRDTGDDRWNDDENMESVGPEVPSSYDNDDDMTTGEMDFNGRMEIPDELRPETYVPPPQKFRPRRGLVITTSKSQIRGVHFNDDPMEASSASSRAQPQPPQTQPQPQHPRRRPPHQLSWKAGVVGLYGACTPDMDPISGVGEKKGRAPRMFRQPPKRKSDVVKATKQTALRKCMNELMGIEKDADLKTFVGATPGEVKRYEKGMIQDPTLHPMRPYLLKHATVAWNDSLCTQFVDYYEAELKQLLTEDQRDEVAMMFDERLQRMSRTWQGYQKERENNEATEALQFKMKQKAKRTRENSRRNGLFKDRLAISAGNMHNRDGTINPEWKASYDMVHNLGPSGMSSDESEEEDGHTIYIIKARGWRSHAVSKRCKIIDRERNSTSSLGGAPAGNPPRKRKRVTRPTLSSRDPVIGCPKNYYSALWVANLPNRGVSELKERQNHDLRILPGEESD